MISPPSSVVLEINGFSVHYYGIIMFFAIIAALFVIRYVAKKYYKDVDTNVLLDVLPAVILFSLIGARLYYVLMDFSYYAKYPSEIIAVWNGGMSIHGAILGGIISGLVFSKIHHFSFLKYADVFPYGLAIGQAIGRFGNYFNCEQHRPFGYEQYSYFHPAFLYESLWDICVFLLLFFVIRKFVQKYKLKDGTVFFSYLLLYSFGRIFVEWCRIDSVKSFWGIPVAQIASITIIAVSLIFLVLLNKRKGKI